MDVGLGKYAKEMNVGPGLYNIHDGQIGKGHGVKISPEHKTKKSKSVAKLPSVHTYNPLPTYPSF